MLSTNPFIVLSYVSGPAILTNAAALLLLSTSNRFARAIDRSRHLARNVQTLSESGRTELVIAARRVRLIARTMTSLYLSAATFAVATLMSVLGAVIAEAAGGTGDRHPDLRGARLRVDRIHGLCRRGRGPRGRKPTCRSRAHP